VPALVVAAALALVPVAAPVATAREAGVPVAETRCSVNDPRLVELSGLAVVDGGVWAMADGGRRVALYRLDPATCAVVESRTAAVDPYDAEDLAAAPDGTLWVSDTGDNERRRATVAMIVVPSRGPAQLHRLTYPDGPHDAEALLLDARGVPTVVTKEIGAAGIYRPEGPLTGTGPTPLVRVGDLVLPPSDTVGGPIGRLGARTVTGGAVSPDGRVLAVRTYTDAWLYAVPNGGGPDGDVVAALRGTPVRVPLPGEPQGEAVAITADGTLLSGSETRGSAVGQLRAVPGAGALAQSGSTQSAPAGPAPTSTPAGTTGAATGGTAPVGPAPVAEPVSTWRTATIGAGAVVVVLGLLAAAMVRHAARRR
jgi:hypothetical protein